MRRTVLRVALIGAVVPWMGGPMMFGAGVLMFVLVPAIGLVAMPITVVLALALILGLWNLVGGQARKAGASRPRSVATIATGGLGGCVVLMYLVGSPWDGSPSLPVVAVMSAASAVGCCLAVLPSRSRLVWIPFALLAAGGILVVLLAPTYRDLQAANEIRTAIDTHGQDFAVLDDDAWHPEGVGEHHDTLQVTYRNDAEETVVVSAWDEDRRFNQSTAYTLRHSCDYDQMTCTEQGDLLLRENEGVVDDVRMTLDDGTIVSVQAGDDTAVDLVAIAEQVRRATPEDREELVEAVADHRS